jgi:hypothetical protein
MAICSVTKALTFTFNLKFGIVNWNLSLNFHYTEGPHHSTQETVKFDFALLSKISDWI